MNHVRVLFAGVVLLLTSACMHGREGFVRADGAKRAAFEMKCDQASLKIVEINSNTIGVEGCGQSVVYKLVQTTSGGGMDWVRD